MNEKKTRLEAIENALVEKLGLTFCPQCSSYYNKNRHYPKTCPACSEIESKKWWNERERPKEKDKESRDVIKDLVEHVSRLEDALWGPLGLRICVKCERWLKLPDVRMFNGYCEKCQLQKELRNE